MKKIRRNMKMIIGIILGVIISVTTSYVLAATLINSKDVVYQDNMSIGATNVQNAIDGTCSKIDTRLSAIEDKLWNINNFFTTNFATSTTTLSYTNIYIDIPAKSFCSINLSAFFNDSQPLTLTLSTSSTVLNNNTIIGETTATSTDRMLVLNYAALYEESSRRIYIWLKCGNNTGTDAVSYSGYCATKAK